MIGRVYRGGNVGGLLRYLYGPGRHNEHESPHLVAAWDLTSAQELATLEPEVLSGDGAHAVRDFRPMTASMELATVLRPASVTDRMVWHCPLRVAPGDRSLTDAEWAQVARDVASGALVTVLWTDPAAAHDVPAWVRMRGHHLVGTVALPPDPERAGAEPAFATTVRVG